MKYRKLILQLFAFTLIFCVGISSCTHEPIIEAPNGGQQINSSNCDPDTVYFQNDILPILISSCAYSGCHDAASSKDGVVLDNYSDVFTTGEVKPGDPDDSELYEVIVESNPNKIMPPPPNSPLTADQISLIETWILQGAINNSCSDCDTLSVTYNSHVAQIMNSNCTVCHGDVNPDANLSLTSFSSVQSAVNTRGLFDRISRQAGEIGVMPTGGPMNDCNIATIEIWIREGMPE